MMLLSCIYRNGLVRMQKKIIFKGYDQKSISRTNKRCYIWRFSLSINRLDNSNTD